MHESFPKALTVCVALLQCCCWHESALFLSFSGVSGTRLSRSYIIVVVLPVDKSTILRERLSMSVTMIFESVPSGRRVK